MKRKTTIKLTLILLTVTALLSFDMPKEWAKVGSAPDNYEMGN